MMNSRSVSIGRGCMSIGLVLLCLAGCASTNTVRGSSGTVTGKVYVTGNEPFTKIALQLDDGSAYVLLCSKELDEQLTRLQGKTVKISYNELKDVPEGKALRVVSMEQVSQEH